MLVSLDTKFIGPAEEFHLKFGKRLTILTGDNGLGKSLLLDLAFFACAEEWAEEVAVPQSMKLEDASISVCGDSDVGPFVYSFIPQEGRWRLKGDESREMYFKLMDMNKKKLGGGWDCGLIVYSKVDGGYSVFDMSRRGSEGFNGTSEGYYAKLTPSEIMNGKQEKGILILEGLRRDWEVWKYRRPELFEKFCSVLKKLSAPGELLEDGGEPIRLPGPDSREWPVLNTANGKVPISHVSSAVKRILLLAYMIMGSYWENIKTNEANKTKYSRSMIVIIDEVETHLHPRWQRGILSALLSLADVIDDFDIQFIVSTHSPLVMASLEPIFDEERDAWYDLDFEDGNVQLRRRSLEKHGDVEGWLKSEAFDLDSTRPAPYAKLLEQATDLMGQENPSLTEVSHIHGELIQALAPTDAFLMRWRYVGEKKGWIK